MLPNLVFAVILLSHLLTPTFSANQARVVLSSRDGSDIAMSNVIGREITFPNGKIVREFLGIPYAQPPIRERRFRISFPFGSLGRYFNATTMQPPCVQTVLSEPTNPTHEDCLYLNIWAPNDLYKFGAGYAILVAFVSGGFDGTNQNDALFNGLKLAQTQDIIVVTVSYRVGVFGFLRTDNNEIPGNFGLYDQKLALEWITANINDFGGDRSRITLLGNGASAATIGYLLLSNAIGNLFKWAIMHGGSPLSSWAYVTPYQAENRAKKIASLVGCNSNVSPRDLASCLRSVESGKLLSAAEKITQTSYYQYVFAPTQDGVIINQNPDFLLRNGYNKKTEIMIGTTGKEGIHFFEQIFRDIRMVDASVSSKSTLMSHNLLKFAVSLLLGSSNPPRASIAANQIPEDTIPTVLQELIIYEYKNWEQPDNKTALFESFQNIVQDRYYNCPILKFAKAFSSSGSGAYVFKLPYFEPEETRSWSGSNYQMKGKTLKEVSDTGIQLVFGNSDENDILLQTIMSAWGNMTKTGNPNTGSTDVTSIPDPLTLFTWQKWNPFTRKRMVFVDPTEDREDEPNFDLPDVMQEDVWKMSEQCAFWNEHIPMQLNNEREKCERTSEITIKTGNTDN